MLRCVLCTVLSHALASPAMGHSATCPLDFQLFNFSRHFRAAQTNIWLNAVAYPVRSLQVCHCLLHEFHIIFLYVTLKLFSACFCAPPRRKSWWRHWTPTPRQCAWKQQHQLSILFALPHWAGLINISSKNSVAIYLTVHLLTPHPFDQPSHKQCVTR